MFLGIDLGTSAVKALLVDAGERVIATASAPLDVKRPETLWSEQDPEAWWQAADAAVCELAQNSRKELSSVQGIGLSGQMHGATLLDAQDRPLRPAILWNDGRSSAECAELEKLVPGSRDITGNIAMPGFTAPKLLWVKQHEPLVFGKVARVLLPKDYLRLRLSGDYASDVSDSAGTLWLNVRARRWSAEMLEATGLTEAHMPALFEGSAMTGQIRSAVAQRWGLPGSVPIAAGAGDNAAGAVGLGVVAPGQAFVSLGTSGVYFVSCESCRPYPDGAVHTFCHAIAGRWHQMSVILSAASCLSWITRLLGAEDEAALLAEIEAADRDSGALVFLPYLSGERTPHNDPHAKGVFFGLTHETTRADLARAVLEGVAFAFADGQAMLGDAGTPIEEVSVIGGGARSALWGKILAAVLDRPLVYPEGGELGPAFGAARLARLAATGESVEAVCVSPPVVRSVQPDAQLRDRYSEKLQLYRRLYRELRESFHVS